MSALRTTGADLAAVLSNLSQQQLECLPTSVLRDCANLNREGSEDMSDFATKLRTAKFAREWGYARKPSSEELARIAKSDDERAKRDADWYNGLMERGRAMRAERLKKEEH